MAKPTGVRLVRPDGPPINLDDDLAHDGVDENGIDKWTIGYANFRPGIDSIQCDTLPGRTSLGFNVLLDGSGGRS